MVGKLFEGANVCMSRNLVPPELFDTLHDALKLNGANILLCCDPSRNGPSDYHVIYSKDHEKFEDLRAKGCKLIGPQCVLSCAKEQQPLPDRDFTCCLAMDGVSILASGFERDEKGKVASMVFAMGGVLLTKASSDANFVIVKNVLAQKYKWALNNLKKPIVTINWLIQCWKEHRIVPQESYRVPPFLGLTICVSGIPADERKRIENLVVQNGGQYSGDLNKRCSHLICDGDKYKVAKRWGNIRIVSIKWIHQCVTRRACLNEESYPCGSVSFASAVKTERYSQKGPRSSQCTSSSMSIASDINGGSFAVDSESYFPRPPLRMYSEISGHSPLHNVEGLDDKIKDDSSSVPFIADDSQSEDDDLYLSNCRIMLIGFVASELRKLVGMVRQGGGSRYMYLSERLTHIIIGKPMENEIKEVRSIAAFGVTYVVKTTWLEECTIKKKEVPVQQCHIAYDLLIPKDPVISDKLTATSMKQQQSCVAPSLCANITEPQNSNNGELRDSKDDSVVKVHTGPGTVPSKDIRSSTVFKGKLFGFSSSFPEEQRPEITMWVNGGGGEVVSDHSNGVNFTIERHGVGANLALKPQSTFVTTHWIRSCLEDGSLLDVNCHILYSPLSCEVPLPGFESYRICISQYDSKERNLLRNLCYVLGAKFFEKLTKKATHLLCKFANGEKYQAACAWGKKVVTAEWLHECVVQNKIVDVRGFHPKELTLDDQEPGSSLPVTQYPLIHSKTPSSDETSQLVNQLRDSRGGESYLSRSIKRARTVEGDVFVRHQPGDTKYEMPHRLVSAESGATENTKEVTCAVPDVAAAIEDLLEQTSKIQDWKPQETIFILNLPPDPATSMFWITGLGNKEKPTTMAMAKCIYDGFSETQTDSQVVGYEEDLSGRQMIIDRVRARTGSSMAED